MSASDLNASLVIRGGRQGGTDPWRDVATLALDSSGFHDTEGIGREGDAPGGLDIASVRDSLLASFDRADLIALLDRVVALRDALAK
jgi:hypothetical protein